MSSKHQIAHTLDARHRDVERSIGCLHVSQGYHDGQRVNDRGVPKVVGKMRFINPTFQCPCKWIISGNRMRYSPGRLSGNVCRVEFLGNTV